MQGNEEDSRTALARVILSSLPRVVVTGMAPELAAIMRSTVVAAGLDPLDVGAWVEASGGYEANAYVRHKDAAGDARGLRAPLHPEPYFAIPLTALDAAPAFSVSGVAS